MSSSTAPDTSNRDPRSEVQVSPIDSVSFLANADPRSEARKDNLAPRDMRNQDT